MNALTARQQEVLAYIQYFIGENQRPPTRQEIAGHFGFSSPSAAQDHIKALARKGAIHLVAGKSRGLEVAS